MDQSSAQQTRSSPWLGVVEHAQADPCFGRLAKEARARIQEAARVEKLRELSLSFEAGREQGNVDSWISGAKTGAVCGLVLGLAIGCAGGMFWMAAGFAAK